MCNTASFWQNSFAWSNFCHSLWRSSLVSRCCKIFWYFNWYKTEACWTKAIFLRKQNDISFCHRILSQYIWHTLSNTGPNKIHFFLSQSSFTGSLSNSFISVSQGCHICDAINSSCTIYNFYDLANFNHYQPPLFDYLLSIELNSILIARKKCT